MRIIKAIIVFLSCFLLLSSSLWAYGGNVHPKINEESVNLSNLNFALKNQLGFENGINNILTKGKKTRLVWQWIANGGEAEDFGWFGKHDMPRTRAYNHFHDPLKPWNEAGLDNLLALVYEGNYLKSPVSIILWGLNSGQQDFPMNFTGDWSWDKAREFYYTYFTGKEFSGKTIAAGEDEKEACLVDCFRAVGQIMHLLEDMSVPLHTRNDAHIIPFFGIGRWTYETFTTMNWRSLDYTPYLPGNFQATALLIDPQPDPSFANLVPVTGLFDRNHYNGNSIPASDANVGLAEYTNANFLTNDTLWEYPHPALEETNYDESIWLTPETVDAEDGKQDNRIYFGKDTGEPIDHLLAAGYWYYQLYMWNKPELMHAFIVDEECFAEYASKLIPRATGYSAALLDYFFRGSIEITLPSNQYHSGVYSMIEDPDQGFTHIILNARNTTPDGDEMTDGSIELVVKYKLTLNGVDPFQSKYIETTENYSYITAEAKDIFQIPRNESVELKFELKEALPINATDVTINLVYRGMLGNEQDAIAVGYKDISEPTPLDIFSNLDKVCLAGKWLDAGSKEAIALVDENGNGISDENEIDVYPHDVKDYYARLSSISDPQAPLQDPEDIHIPEIKAGEFKREAFFLGDDELALSDFSLWSPCSYPDDDHYGSQIYLNTDTLTSFRRQTYWLSAEECASMGKDPGCGIRRYPSLTSFRGVEMHGVRITHEDESWGHDNTCSLDDLN